MKAQKIITLVTVILLVVIISFASFVGIYQKKDYKVVNVVPKYTLGMQFNNSRKVTFTVDDSTKTKILDSEGKEIVDKDEETEYTEANGYKTVEEKVNSSEILTEQNYKASKKIFKNRLKKLGVDEFIISKKENGTMEVQIPENEDTDSIIAYLTQKGELSVVDAETQEVLINKDSVKKASVVYGQTESATTVYVQIEFNKEGSQKLEEISKIYVSTTSQVESENGEMEDKETTKNVSIMLDGEVLRTTYFGDTITNGVLNIPIGAASDADGLKNYVQAANDLAVILNNGILPIAYTYDSEVIDPTFNGQNTLLYIFAGLIVLMFIYLVIRLKTKSILPIILEVGYIALLLLALRYTDIKITLTGFLGIAIAMLLNCIYICMAFMGKEENVIKKITLNYLPVYVVAIVITFSRYAQISSIGISLVWGTIVMYIYNLTLTNLTVKALKK